MKFLTLLSALTLIYYWPRVPVGQLQRLFLPYIQRLEHNCNDGKNKHGIIAWILGALVPALIIGVIYYLLLRSNIFLGFLFALIVLYFTLAFSHFGGRAKELATALEEHNIDEAQRLLSQWAGIDASQFSAIEIARVGIETTLKNAHHGLFAPILWFVVLGPAGAVLYRLAYLIKLEWHPLKDNPFNKFTQQAFEWLDWLPARFTAACFAIVGDFEDAIFCWRTQSKAWNDNTEGFLLASGAGALGVKLGESLTHPDGPRMRPELGLGDDADAEYLESSVGLIWRVLILIVGLLCLLTFASWLGS